MSIPWHGTCFKYKYKHEQRSEIMNKKTLTILGVIAGIVVVLVVGYLVYMYGIMPDSQM